MKKFLFTLLIIINACASAEYDIIYEEANRHIDRDGTIIVFPFRNPSGSNKIKGVGEKFTESFAGACRRHGLNAETVFNYEFQTRKHISARRAVQYAKEKGYDYVITGRVTKYDYEENEMNGVPGSMGLLTEVKSVYSDSIVYSAIIEERISHWNSKEPSLHMYGLAEAMVMRILGLPIEGLGKQYIQSIDIKE